MPRSPTRWEREEKATLLSLLLLVGLVLLAAFCGRAHEEVLVAPEQRAQSNAPP